MASGLNVAVMRTCSSRWVKSTQTVTSTCAEHGLWGKCGKFLMDDCLQHIKPFQYVLYPPWPTIKETTERIEVHEVSQFVTNAAPSAGAGGQVY